MGREVTIHVVPSSGGEVTVRVRLSSNAAPTAAALVAAVKKEKPILAREDLVVCRKAREDLVGEEEATTYKPDDVVHDEMVLLISSKHLKKTRVAVATAPVEKVKTIPAPQLMRQDVMPAGFLVNLCELIDNAIGAAAGYKDARVTVEVVHDDVRGKCLVIEDNGRGMTKEVLRKCSILAKSYSTPPVLVRDNKPLRFSSFVDPHFNRWGRGLSSWVYFGNNLCITTKVANTAQVYSLSADYLAWESAHKQEQSDREWENDIITESAVTAHLHASSFTRLTIWNLCEDAEKQLAPERLKEHVAQVASIYHFHLNGMPGFLHKWLPSVLEFGWHPPLVRLRVFESDIPPPEGTVLPFSDRTNLEHTLRPAEANHKDSDKLKPLILAFRWVKHGHKLPGAQQGTGVEGGSGAAAPRDASPQPAKRRAVGSGSGPAAGPSSRAPGAAADEGEDADDYWQELSAVASGLPVPATGESGPPASISHGAFVGPSLQRRGKRGSIDPAGPVDMGRGGRGGGRGRKRLLPEPFSPPGAAGGSSSHATTPGTASPSAAGRARQAAEDHAAQLHFIDTASGHRSPYLDLLLILLYYPYRDGKPTKPLPSTGCVPLWSGRVMPRDQLNKQLPYLVQAARDMLRAQQQSGSSHLDRNQVGGLVLISPDFQVGRNKGSVDDAAIEEFIKLGSHRHPGAEFGEEPHGTWHVFNYAMNEFCRDPDGALAANMLAHHFKTSWLPAEDEGVLVGEVRPDPDGLLCSKQYQPPLRTGADVMVEGQLVRHLGQKASGPMSDDSVEPDGRSTGRAARSKTSTVQRKACVHYVIERFTQRDGDHVHVELTRWLPKWATEQECSMPYHKLRVPVAEVVPLAPSTDQRLREQDKHAVAWEQACPHHLAYLKPGSKDSGTRDPLCSASLQAFAEGQVPVGSFKQVVLALCAAEGKSFARSDRSHYSVKADNVAVHARLLRKAPGAPGYQADPVWRGTCPITSDVAHFYVQGFEPYITEPGEYQLIMTLEHDKGGYLHPDMTTLTYAFEVVPLETGEQELRVEWVGAVPPYVRVGTPLPPLRVMLYRGTRQDAFPATDAQRLLPALMVVVEREGGGGGADEGAGPSSSRRTGGSAASGSRASKRAPAVVEVPANSAGRTATAKWDKKDNRSAVLLQGWVLPLTLLKKLVTNQPSTYAAVHVVYDPTVLDTRAPSAARALPPGRAAGKGRTRPGASCGAGGSTAAGTRQAAGGARSNGAANAPIVLSSEDDGSDVGEDSSSEDEGPADVLVRSVNHVNVCVASGPACGMHAAFGDPQPGALPPELDIAKGAYLPNDIVISVTDAQGSPFFWPASSEAHTGGGGAVTGGAGPSSSAMAGSVLAGGAAGGQGEGWPPRLKIALTGLRFKGRASGVIPLSAMGRAVLSRDDFMVHFPWTRKASLDVSLDAATFPERGSLGVQHGTVRVPVSITRCHLTFLHPSLPPEPNENRTVPSPRQDGVTAAYLLDLLIFCKGLKLPRNDAVRVPITSANWAVYAERIMPGMQEVLPGVYLSPSGQLFKCLDDVITLVSNVQKDPNMRVYEGCCVLGHRATVLSGVKLQMATWAEDKVDPTFCAPFKVMLETEVEDGTVQLEEVYDRLVGPPLGDSKERQDDTGGYALPDLDLQPKVLPRLRDAHTARLRVVDPDDHKAVYGTYYVRQGPRPASMILLPSSPAMRSQLAHLTFTLRRRASDVSAPSNRRALVQPQMSRVGLRPPAEFAPAEGGVQVSNVPAPPGRDARCMWGGVVGGRVQDEGIDVALDRVNLDPGVRIKVAAGQVFKVHVLLRDQFGLPLKVSAHLQSLIQSTAHVAAAFSGAAHASRAAAEAELVPDAWRWDAWGANCELSVVELGVRVKGQGQLDLTLTFPDLPAVPHACLTSTLVLTIPLIATAGPLAREGIRVEPPPTGSTMVVRQAAEEEVVPVLPRLHAAVVRALSRPAPEPTPASHRRSSATPLSPDAPAVPQAASQVPAGLTPGQVRCVELCDGASHKLTVKLTDALGFALEPAAVQAVNLCAELLPADATAAAAAVAAVAATSPRAGESGSQGTPTRASNGSPRAPLRVRLGPGANARAPHELTVQVPRYAAGDRGQEGPSQSPVLHAVLIRPCTPGSVALPVVLLITVTPGSYPAKLHPILGHDDWQGCRNCSGPAPEFVPEGPLPALAPPPQVRYQPNGMEITMEQVAEGVVLEIPGFSVVCCDNRGRVWRMRDTSQDAFPSVALHWERLVSAEQGEVWEPEPLPPGPRAGEPAVPPALSWPRGGPAVVRVPPRPVPNAAGIYRLRLKCDDDMEALVGPVVLTQPPCLVAQLSTGDDVASSQAGITAPLRLPGDSGRVQPVLESQAQADAEEAGVAGLPGVVLRATGRTGLPLSQLHVDAADVVLQLLDDGSGDVQEEWVVHAACPAPGTPLTGAGGVPGQWLIPALPLHALASAPGRPGPVFTAGQHFALVARVVLSQEAARAADTVRPPSLGAQDMSGPGLDRKRAQGDGTLPDLLLARWVLTSAANAAVGEKLAAAQLRANSLTAQRYELVTAQKQRERNVSNAVERLRDSLGSFSSTPGIMEQVTAPTGRERMVAKRTELLRRLENYPLGPHPPRSLQSQEELEAHAAAEGNFRLRRLHMPRDYHTAHKPNLYLQASTFVHKYRVDQALGLVAQLLRCERMDVCRALMGYLGSRAHTMVLVHKDPQLERECRQYVPTNRILFLGKAEVFDSYTTDPELPGHTQRCLSLSEPQPGVTALLNRDVEGRRYGWVGYATNLVYLPPLLLTWTLRQPRRNRAFTLRQSLVYKLFAKLMVFETFAGLQTFEADLRGLPQSGGALNRSTRMISLDGGSSNLEPGVEGHNEPYTWPLMLAGVSEEEQLESRMPLDIRLRPVRAGIDQFPNILAALDQLTARRREQEEQDAADAVAIADLDRELAALKERITLLQEVLNVQSQYE